MWLQAAVEGTWEEGGDLVEDEEREVQAVGAKEVTVAAEREAQAVEAKEGRAAAVETMAVEARAAAPTVETTEGEAVRLVVAQAASCHR
eukprot:5847165-Prymnesium_polylepis.1